MNKPALASLAAQFAPRFLQVRRGARFFLVVGLMVWGGKRMEAALHCHVDRLGWATVALVALGLLAYR